MANFFSKLFGSSKKGSDYTGTEPVHSLSQVMGGKDYYDRLMARMNGQGVGFGGDYASLANPQVANLRNTFNSYTMPELTAELSRTGRRRSSGGFDQIRRAYTEQGLNENDIVARLAQRQAEAQREDINNAISGLGNFAQNEANLTNNKANFDYRNNQDQLQREDQRQLREAAGYQGIGQLGISLAAMPFTGGVSALTPNTSTSYANYNPLDPRNNVGFGKSGNSLNTRLLQRSLLRGRIE